MDSSAFERLKSLKKNHTRDNKVILKIDMLNWLDWGKKFHGTSYKFNRMQIILNSQHKHIQGTVDHHSD